MSRLVPRAILILCAATLPAATPVLPQHSTPKPLADELCDRLAYSDGVVADVQDEFILVNRGREQFVWGGQELQNSHQDDFDRINPKNLADGCRLVLEGLSNELR